MYVDGCSSSLEVCVSLETRISGVVSPGKGFAVEVRFRDRGLSSAVILQLFDQASCEKEIAIPRGS